MTASSQQLLVTTASGTQPHASLAPRRRLPFIATPLGLMLIIPLLVGGAAVGALVLYQNTLQVGVREMGGSRVIADATVVRQRALFGLGQVAALLSGVHAWADRAGPLDDRAAVARVLIGMADGRPGVCQVYLGRPDGSMFGVTRTDADWQVIEVAPGLDGSRRSLSRIQADGSLLVERVEERVAFDARLRPWYVQAVAAPGAVWTEPYRFARSGLPGVTIARQLAPSAPGLPPRGVVAVDLDLSSFGTALQLTGDLGRNVVFNRSLALIALPPEMLKDAPCEGLPTGSNLRDPVARAFFAAIRTLPEDSAPLPIRATSEGAEYGGFVHTLNVPSGPTWYIAQIASRDAIVGMMDRAKQRGLLGAGAAVAIGILAGLFFAGLLARTRREVDAQRSRARDAEAKVRELGSYTLVRKLGEGGMGEVWVGEHRMLSRQAAVKMISPKTLERIPPSEIGEARRRFEQEARITASLRARSTVELYDYGVAADGTFYYVMELLDGVDLRALVERFGAQPAGRVVQLLVQALSSLAEAHDRGLVHRDIKPENMFICRRSDEVDVVKVLDFGLVRIASAPAGDRLTTAGMVTGTPTTMAPEQATGKALDGRTDLYAIGCVACWLLTASEVFTAGTPFEVLTMHLNDPPRPLRARNPAVPEALAALVESCLAKDPAQRPRDARSLALALTALELPSDQAWTQAQAKAWWERLPKPPVNSQGA